MRRRRCCDWATAPARRSLRTAAPHRPTALRGRPGDESDPRRSRKRIVLVNSSSSTCPYSNTRAGGLGYKPVRPMNWSRMTVTGVGVEDWESRKYLVGCCASRRVQVSRLQRAIPLLAHACSQLRWRSECPQLRTASMYKSKKYEESTGSVDDLHVGLVPRLRGEVVDTARVPCADAAQHLEPRPPRQRS